MPILDVELVTAEVLPEGLAQELAEAAAKVFRSPPASTWVKLRTLHPSCYAENESVASDEPYPAFVTILRHEHTKDQDLSSEVEELTLVIATLLARPVERVHLLYAPEAKGRIAFGGKLRI